MTWTRKHELDSPFRFRLTGGEGEAPWMQISIPTGALRGVDEWIKKVKSKVLGGFSAVFLQLRWANTPVWLKKYFGSLLCLLGTSSNRKTNVLHWHQQGKLQLLQEVRICRLHFTNIYSPSTTTGNICWCFLQSWNYVTGHLGSQTWHAILFFSNIYWLMTLFSDVS